jgi:cytochrome c oxidase subunit 4
MATEHAHPVTPASTYFLTFIALLVFTALTVYAARIDFAHSMGPDYAWVNTVVALAIAVTKASLVVIYFMGVRHNTPLTKVVVVAGFFWLFILFGLGLSDYFTRDILAPGR